MKLSECGYKVVVKIQEAINQKHIALPTEISLKHLEELSGCRVQSIGMCFDDYIKPALLENKIIANKCGKPVVIQLHEKDA